MFCDAFNHKELDLNTEFMLCVLFEYFTGKTSYKVSSYDVLDQAQLKQSVKCKRVTEFVAFKDDLCPQILYIEWCESVRILRTMFQN